MYPFYQCLISPRARARLFVAHVAAMIRRMLELALAAKAGNLPDGCLPLIVCNLLSSKRSQSLLNQIMRLRRNCRSHNEYLAGRFYFWRSGFVKGITPIFPLDRCAPKGGCWGLSLSTRLRRNSGRAASTSISTTQSRWRRKENTAPNGNPSKTVAPLR